MSREIALTIAIYVVLLALSLTSFVGLLLALGWFGVGAWMVFRTRSRGLLADMSFLATWPIYVALGW